VVSRTDILRQRTSVAGETWRNLDVDDGDGEDSQQLGNHWIREVIEKVEAMAKERQPGPGFQGKPKLLGDQESGI
jgi:hypothetical protein